MTLTEELKKRMKEKEYSLTQVSKSLNASSATIHLWLNNKYTGNVEKINDAVKNFWKEKNFVKTE